MVRLIYIHQDVNLSKTRFKYTYQHLHTRIKIRMRVHHMKVIFIKFRLRISRFACIRSHTGTRLFWQTMRVTGNLFTLMLIMKDWLVVQSLKEVGISCSTSWTIVYYNLKISDTSEALEVGRSTIKRRLKEYGISISERKTDITDTELDFVVRNIQQDFPNAGYRRMQSQLSLRGIKILFLRRECVHQCSERIWKGWQ